MNYLFIFVLLLVNVTLATTKTIWTVGGSDTKASIINAVTYGYYIIVMRFLVTENLVVMVTLTILANLIGVRIARTFTKDKTEYLWKITATVKGAINIGTIGAELIEQNVSFTELHSVGDRATVFFIYSYTQKESAMLKIILKKVKAKYCVEAVTLGL